MKIEELLNDSWKDIINKNFKWLIAVMIRYASLTAIGVVFLLFIFLNYIKAGCSNTDNSPVFVIKQGKTINVTKVGKENNAEQVKEIDTIIKELESLRGK